MKHTITFWSLILTLYSCNSGQSTEHKMSDLVNSLDQNGLLSTNENEWLRDHSFGHLSSDSVLSVLRVGFLQDFPNDMQSVIERSSNGFLGIADRALAYPNQNGPVYINMSDNQIDSLVRGNKQLVDILSMKGLVPAAKADSIKTIIGERAVVFKYDVIRGIMQLN